MSRQNNLRPTIGILPGWLAYEGVTPDRYLNTVFSGIRAQADARGCNILLAWGGGRAAETSRGTAAWPVLAPDSDFVPVSPSNTDGLIVLAPLLNKNRSDYIQNVRANGHPVLFIASGETGPAIIYDNEKGIRQAIAHLVDHGHRQIAYIAGDPDDAGDSQERLNAFLSAVSDLNLAADSRLIEPGKHSHSGGYAAMWKIIQSGVPFTAVQASDDVSAIGAMKALREAGLRVPQDVAVIGFDDQQDALAQIPPLTSVHVPLIEIGAKAVDIMLDHLVQNQPLETTRISTYLSRRQSCGCLPERMFLAIPRASITRPPLKMGAKPDIAEFKFALVEKMVAALPEKKNLIPGFSPRPLFTALVEALFTAIHTRDLLQFTSALFTILQELEQSTLEMNNIQDAISALRFQLLASCAQWPELNDPPLIEDLLHQARVAVSESVERFIFRHHNVLEARAYTLSLITSRLSASLDRHQTIKLLQENLPKIGLRQAAVILFEPEKGNPVARSQVISSEPEDNAPYLQFQTEKFPPPGLFPANEPLSLALVPLVFQNESMGYAAFDAGDLTSISVIALQLAANLKVAQLHSEVVDLSLLDALSGAYNRRFLEIFLKKEVDRCHRYHRGLAVIMLDIDGFKNYNDHFGHPAGDLILKSLAKCIQDNQRKLDVVVRYGGDEFAVILPEADENGAVMVAENIRTSAQQLLNGLTLSLGVAILITNEYNADELIQNADRALYDAKRSGLDRVCLFKKS